MAAGKIVERWNWLERWTHTFHVLAMLTLIITGIKIYLGWEFMSFHNARALHMIAVPVLLVTNWILVPYNILAGGLEAGHGIKGVISHFLDGYILNGSDIKRIKGIFSNFFGKGEYPAYTIYNEEEGHYKTKLHPIFKPMIVIEGTAIAIITLTGIVLYSLTWSPLGLPISSWIISLMDILGGFIGMNGLAFNRMIHLLMTYWFIFELVVHALILEFDPKVFKYWKAVFVNGKEDLSDRHFVEVIKE